MSKRGNRNGSTKPPAKRRKTDRALKKLSLDVVKEHVATFVKFSDAYRLNEGSVQYTPPDEDEMMAHVNEVFATHIVTKSNLLRHKLVAKITMQFLDFLKKKFENDQRRLTVIVEELMSGTYDANPNKLDAESPALVIAALHTVPEIKTWFQTNVPALKFENKQELTKVLSDTRRICKKRHADLVSEKYFGKAPASDLKFSIPFLNALFGAEMVSVVREVVKEELVGMIARREDYQPMRNVSDASQSTHSSDSDEEDYPVAPPSAESPLAGFPPSETAATSTTDLMGMSPRNDQTVSTKNTQDFPWFMPPPVAPVPNPDPKYQPIRLTSGASEDTNLSDEKKDKEDDHSPQMEKSFVSLTPPPNTKIPVPPPPPATSSSAGYMADQAVDWTGMSKGFGFNSGLATNMFPLSAPPACNPNFGFGAGVTYSGAAPEGNYYWNGYAPGAFSNDWEYYHQR